MDPEIELPAVDQQELEDHSSYQGKKYCFVFLLKLSFSYKL